MIFSRILVQVFYVFAFFSCISVNAQEQWGSFFTSIDATNLHGKKFKLQADIVEDRAALHGWVVNWINRDIQAAKSLQEKKLNEMMRDYPDVPIADLEKIQTPCLIMEGDTDMIRLEHLVKLFQHLPNSQLCILPGARHGGAWEQQERFLSIMNDFLRPFSMPDSKAWVE
ncbi:hypothetical protein DC498_15985 [Terrimonas sp.]|uniref:alpha/beta fold hydrolase n=1 Tax=Terrimonas sp. TaxID=1914338 RepID=UPI000D50A5AB|nr:alpha/beta hydrolase [Terrimonas sp.]PVD51151.1 hypothetical protein DC498_15985 [Terrimonas sp.]